MFIEVSSLIVNFMLKIFQFNTFVDLNIVSPNPVIHSIIRNKPVIDIVDARMLS